MGNHGASVNKSSHAESSWHLNELTDGAVTIEAGSLFEKDDFLRRRRLGPSNTLKG